MRKNLPYQIFWMEQEIEEEKDKIYERINSKCFVKEVEDEKIIKNFTFKQLYLKLHVQNKMIHFIFFINDLGILKSDYN